MPETQANETLLSPELLSKLERMELISRKIFRGRMKGERRSKRKGQSVEFADFRNYVAGDDLRFIDWNLYARMDRLIYKLFLEEEDLHFYALVDDSLSMDFGDPSKIHVAKQLAAALGYIGLCRGDRVQVKSFSRSASPASPLRGKANVGRLVNELHGIQPCNGPHLEEVIKKFCVRNSGKGIIVLITDLMDKQGTNPPCVFWWHEKWISISFTCYRRRSSIPNWSVTSSSSTWRMATPARSASRNNS